MHVVSVFMFLLGLRPLIRAAEVILIALDLPWRPEGGPRGISSVSGFEWSPSNILMSASILGANGPGPSTPVILNFGWSGSRGC